LHGEPRTLVAITKDESPVYAEVNYQYDTDLNHGLRNLIDYPRIASINSFGFGNWPDLDAFLANLTISHDPGTVVPILVVDPSLRLKPYGKNKVDDSVERVDGNPCPELEKFAGKEYDGSLNFPELDKFKGFQFGNGEFAYVYGVSHRGKSLMVTGFLNQAPKLGEKYAAYDSEWEIQAIKHEKFEDEFRGKDPKYRKKQFSQHLNLVLKHLAYHPPLSPLQQRAKIVEDDKLFWYTLVARQGLDVKEVAPLYTDKSPVTPWYQAKDNQSGAEFTMGWRWRVDELRVSFAKPVPSKSLEQAFGNIDTTKHSEDNDGLTSFYMIHAWGRDNTQKYLSQLIEIARGS